MVKGPGGQCSCQDAALPAKFLFIFMRAKIVCFRVVCLYFVDAAEARASEREKEGHALLCCDGSHMDMPYCGGALEGNICPSPELTVSKHGAFGGPC